MKSKLLLPLLAGFILAGCFHATTPAPAQVTPIPTEEVSETPTPTASETMMENPQQGVVELSIEAGEFKFTPPVINAKVGDKIRLTLVNSGKMPHDLRIDELSVSTKILQSGEQETIEFDASTAGSFEFYCSVGSHRKMGMVGTINIR